MANIVTIYSSVDGHTLRICRRLQEIMRQQGHQNRLLTVDDALGADLNPYGKIVIGASIRYGKHRPQVYELIRRNSELLNRTPSAFFSVNVVARKPEKNTPETNPYMKQFRKKVAWKPTALAVFAGKIDYQQYGFWDRHIIRLIMWMTTGPTDPKTIADFTDWAQVEAFGQRICEL